MPFALSDITLSSQAFADNSAIPARHTGEGEDTSPPLKWSLAPKDTASFAVVCHDPDAPLVSEHGTYGFVHWVLYNLPASTTSLEEATQAGTPGQNNFGHVGYGGPMPPENHGVHRYYFWVLALNQDLNLDPGLTMWEFLRQAEPHIVGMNRLVGTYHRD